MSVSPSSSQSSSTYVAVRENAPAVPCRFRRTFSPFNNIVRLYSTFPRCPTTQARGFSKARRADSIVGELTRSSLLCPPKKILLRFDNLLDLSFGNWRRPASILEARDPEGEALPGPGSPTVGGGSRGERTDGGPTVCMVRGRWSAFGGGGGG